MAERSKNGKPCETRAKSVASAPSLTVDTLRRTSYISRIRVYSETINLDLGIYIKVSARSCLHDFVALHCLCYGQERPGDS
jgi:hypothetical protein